MILGMSTATFTLLHVIISLVGIVAGLIVMYGFFKRNPLERWTAVFLATTAITSLSGYAFPFSHLLPSHIVGAISLVVLAIAVAARYPLHMAGAWRSVYVITASLALYLNVFVLVVQSFEKVPTLHALAPTQKEPPFAVAQLVVMILFVTLTIFAARRFRAQPVLARVARAA